MNFLFFSVIFLALLYVLAVQFGAKCRELSCNTGFLSVDIGNICKGVAIILILLSHIGNSFRIRWLTPLGSWGVGVFLFFSGYGLASSVQKKGLEGYWKKRIIAAYIPYITAELIGFFFCLDRNYQEISLIKILKDLFLLKTAHPFGWYMQCLFLSYFMLFVGQKLFSQKRKQFYAFLFAAAAAIFITFRPLFKQQIFSFILGVWVADHSSWVEKKAEKIWNALLLFAMGLLFLLLRQILYIRQLHWILYNLIHAMQIILLTVGSVFLIQNVGSNCSAEFTDIFRRLGLISNELYLYHAFVLSYVVKNQISYYGIVFFFTVSLAVAILMHGLKIKICKFCLDIVQANRS